MASLYFFYLEIAYDTTWKYGIMKDLYDTGLHSHLPLLIQIFLSDRSFRVRVGNLYSNIYSQEYNKAVYYHYFKTFTRKYSLTNSRHFVFIINKIKSVCM